MKLSVVIPTLDEAERIEATVRRALPAPSPSSPGPTGTPHGFAPADGSANPMGTECVDVIVVDGGSRDATRDLARSAGARVLAGDRGRARQLARGVAASSGDVLVLLHADTRLPEGWQEAVSRALADPDVVGGAFGLRFDCRTARMRFIEFGVRVRMRLWRMPYGDQALFVRRAALEAAGGIPQVPIMEDLDLVARLKQLGRLVILPETVVTSARRYLAGGPLRTMGRHWLAAAAWSLGVDRTRVAQWVGR